MTWKTEWKGTISGTGRWLLRTVGYVLIFLALSLLAVGIWRSVDSGAADLAREWGVIPDSTNHTGILSEVQSAQQAALSEIFQSRAQAIAEIEIARRGGTAATELRNKPAPPASPASAPWWLRKLRVLWGLAGHAPLVLLVFALLLIAGLAVVGLAKVLESPGRQRPWKRFWWEGCETFATGIRVLFLIPLVLACWLGIVAAFHVVWQYAPSQQLRAEAVYSPASDGETQRGRGFPAAGPLDPAHTHARVPDGFVDSTTYIVVWPRDAQGVLRRDITDTGRLSVAIASRSGKTERPAFEYRRNGTLRAGYVPKELGTDTVRIWATTAAGVQVPIDTVTEDYLSIVRLRGALPLTQAQNLWFLPVGILIAWMLLWPSEPQDETRKVADAERTAWMNSFAQLFDAVRDQIAERAARSVQPFVVTRLRDGPVRGEQEAQNEYARLLAPPAAPALPAPPAPPAPPADAARQLEEFKNAILRSATFTEKMATPVLNTIAKEAVDRNATEIDSDAIKRLIAWWRR